MEKKLAIYAVSAIGVAAVLSLGAAKTSTKYRTHKLSEIGVVIVKSGAVSDAVMAEGTVVPANVVNVSVQPDMEARVLKTLVNVGQRVQKGTLLAVLDPKETQSSVYQAQQGVVSAQADLNLVQNPHRPEEYAQMAMKLDSDQQTVREAAARLSLLRKGSRVQDIAVAKEAAEAAQIKLDAAKREQQRNTVLGSKDLIPRVELDQSVTNASLAATDLAMSQQRLSLLQEGSQSEEIQIARANLVKAQIEFAQDRQADVMMRQGSRPAEVTRAVSALRKAQNEASHSLQIFDHRFIRSPIAGIVTARNVNTGEVVSSSTPHTTGTAPLAQNGNSLFIVAADSSMEFMARVDQYFYSALHVGQKTNVGLEAYPGRTFTGRIVRISPLINPERVGQMGNNSANPTTPLTFAIWIGLDNTQKLLVPGQIGLITVTQNEPGLLIPQSAVTPYTLGHGVVYVVSRGTVSVRSVQYTAGSNGYVRVRSGLQAGEQIAVSGMTGLKAGDAVKPVVIDTAAG